MKSYAVSRRADNAAAAAPEAARRFRVPKTSEIVANHIRGQIIRGELEEGDSLPPEGQLMLTLGVSRPTLREAFRILEAESLISVVRGSRSGARVHRPKVELVSRYAGYYLQSEGTTVGDLYEARLAIEPHTVRRLSVSKNPEAITRLKAEIDRLKTLVDENQYVEFLVGTAHFHLLLVEVRGNNTLSFLNHLLLDVTTRHQVDYYRRHPLSPGEHHKRFLLGIRSYEKLVRLIESGDADAAVAHWQLHLKNADATWIAPGEGDRIVDALGETAPDVGRF